MKVKFFFGWTNIKWLIKEFIAMYSNRPSYFSKKRFESSIAFLGAMFLIIGHAIYHRDTITNSEMLADAIVLFGIAGYTVKQIQEEKKVINAPGKNTVIEIKPESPKEDFSKDEDAV